MQQHQLRLPPYGKYLQPVDGHTVFLFVDYHRNAFTRAKNAFPNALCLPLYEDPTRYKWPVKGCDVVLFHWQPHDNQEYLNEVIYALFLNKARAVYNYCAPTHECTIYQEQQQ